MARSGRRLPEKVRAVKPEPCRLCGEPTYLADERGPVHPCCVIWFEQFGRPYCRGCRASRELAATSNHYARMARRAEARS
jgi:hypothetical protein